MVAEQNELTKLKRQVRIAVLLPLKTELAGARLVFGDEPSHEWVNTGANYSLYRIPIPSGAADHIVALAMPPEIGNVHAALCVSHLKAEFHDLEYVLVCGIAGGIPHPGRPERDVHLGDVVVLNNDGVLHYDFGHNAARPKDRWKQHVDRYFVKPREAAVRPAPELRNITNGLDSMDTAGQQPWLDRLRARLPVLEQKNKIFTRPQKKRAMYAEVRGLKTRDVRRHLKHSEPKVFHGAIGSGNCVLKNPYRRDELRDGSPPILAVEMEAAGVAAACSSLKLQFTVVRGICDYCDAHKNNVWQPYAAAAAAAYTYCIIGRIPASNRSDLLDSQAAGPVRENALTGAAPTAPSTSVPPNLIPSVSANPVHEDEEGLLLAEALRARLREMALADARHDREEFFRLAQRVETQIERASTRVEPELAVAVLHEVARGYQMAAGSAARPEAFRQRALELIRKARELTP